MQLTDAIVAGLELPAGKVEHFVWDDMAGFGVRLRGGSKRWVIQYRAGRQQRRESLGDTRKLKIEQARKVARLRFAEVELGRDPAADRKTAKADALAAKQTVGAVVESYLKDRKPVLRRSTYTAAERYLRTYWSALHPRSISSIKRADVAAIVLEISTERGRIAAARARANLSALFGWAMKAGLVESNPVIGSIDPSKGVEARERTLSDDELCRVWSACGNDPFGRIVRLLVLLGCRRDEIGALRHGELDLDSGVMTIAASRTKSKRALILTLPPMALDILREIPRRDGAEFVFGTRRGYCAWSYSMMALNARIAATGERLEPWTLHDLRRSFRSGLGRVGIAPHIAERCIGHSIGGVEAIYDRHTYAPEIGNALARWADHVGGVVGVVEGRASNESNVVPIQQHRA
jgi:integrase